MSIPPDDTGDPLSTCRVDRPADGLGVGRDVMCARVSAAAHPGPVLTRGVIDARFDRDAASWNRLSHDGVTIAVVRRKVERWTAVAVDAHEHTAGLEPRDDRVLRQGARVDDG